VSDWQVTIHRPASTVSPARAKTFADTGFIPSFSSAIIAIEAPIVASGDVSDRPPTPSLMLS